jgi:RNA polymerase sigma-B factor
MSSLASTGAGSLPGVPAHVIGGDDALLSHHARTRDPDLRGRLVERYMPLARHAAAHFRHSPEPFDDLVQVASIGLMKAIDRFDPEHGAAFSTYALPTMLGELRRHFRDRGWMVRPPRLLQEHALKVEQTTEALRAGNRVSPTVDAIAVACGLSVEAVLEAREALRGRSAISLSDTGPDDDGHPGLERRIGIVDSGYATAEQRATLDRLAKVLTRRERQVVRLRFDHDLTQAEIGDIVGLSQMQVSRVLRIALEKLRAAAGDPPGRAQPGH